MILRPAFRIALMVFDTKSALCRMCPRYAQCARRPVDTRDLGSKSSQAFGKQATAATDIEHPRLLQAYMIGDVVQPERVDAMKRTEFSVRIPPFLGHGLELFDFSSVIALSGHGRRMRSVTPESKPLCVMQGWGLTRRDKLSLPRLYFAPTGWHPGRGKACET